MYQNIKVEWVEEKKTSTGKPMLALSITEENGTKQKVNIFSDFPDFANIKPGTTIRGKLEKNDKGYLNLISETQAAPRRGNPNFRTEQIEKIMDKKNGSISHFQDRKEEAMSLAGAQRDSVQVVTARGLEGMEDDEIKESIIKWRNWFLSEEFKGSVEPF